MASVNVNNGPSSNLSEPLLEDDIDGRLRERGDYWSWLTGEVKQQVRLAAPIIIVNLLLFSVNCVSLMFVGHLGELALASASIATALATISGYTVLVSSP